MPKREILGLRTLVTGASSGIGRELALELARQGARLLVTAARRTERLEELAAAIREQDGEAHVLPGDVSDAAFRRRLLDESAVRLGGLDALVNNAGVGAVGPFADADPERLRRIMEVNFVAPAELIRLSVPLLATGGRGIIVNVSSVLGHRAVPYKSEYCASKFALHGFSDALRTELAPRGIDVLLVSPSTTDSEFFDNLIDGKERPQRGKMSAAAVAKQTVAAMRRGRREIILSATGKLLVWLDRLAPGIADRLVARFVG